MGSWIHELVENEDVNALREVFADPEYRVFVDDLDEQGRTPLQALIDQGDAANLEVLNLLIEAGANVKITNWYEREILNDVERADIALALLDAGANPADLNHEAKRAILGFNDEADLSGVSRREYEEGKRPHFGTDNPTRVFSPYREAMIRCGWGGYGARHRFEDDYDKLSGDPAWCMDRFGQTLTRMHDGRIILVAGEHEDYYDPDFCIYNDVIVVNPDKSIDIYAYPESVFPPTDFHTATLLGNTIYLVGSLGYINERKPGATPLYCLNTDTLSIARLTATGSSPGRIFRHRATLINNHIHVTGGQKIVEVNGQEEIVAAEGSFSLDLGSMHWTKLE